jgi:putative Mn2+ efflux pump MntP
MTTANTILLLVGILVTIIGLATFISPNLARWINLPGNPTIKAIVSTIVGIILIIIGFVIQFPQ